MREFIILIGQIAFIALVEMILEMLMDTSGKRGHHAILLKLACIMGSLYLLLQFAQNFLINEITAFMNF